MRPRRFRNDTDAAFCAFGWSPWDERENDDARDRVLEDGVSVFPQGIGRQHPYFTRDDLPFGWGAGRVCGVVGDVRPGQPVALRLGVVAKITDVRDVDAFKNVLVLAHVLVRGGDHRLVWLRADAPCSGLVVTGATPRERECAFTMTEVLARMRVMPFDTSTSTLMAYRTQLQDLEVDQVSDHAVTALEAAAESLAGALTEPEDSTSRLTAVVEALGYAAEARVFEVVDEPPHLPWQALLWRPRESEPVSLAGTGTYSDADTTSDDAYVAALTGAATETDPQTAVTARNCDIASPTPTPDAEPVPAAVAAPAPAPEPEPAGVVSEPVRERERRPARAQRPRQPRPTQLRLF